MEPYIKDVSDITYLSELIPTSVVKLWNRILPHLTSRDETVVYPSRKRL